MANGLQRVNELLDELKAEMGKLGSADKPLKVLPGTPYSEFAIPVEYMPSRALAPRWGNTRPIIPSMAATFGRQENDFRRLLDAMVKEIPNLADVPLNFRHENLPTPAWLEVPFCPFDSIALYTLVKMFQPKTFLEIGSGITTCFAYKAIRDASLDTKIVSIDPSPRAAIDSICDKVVRDGLETMEDLSIFAELNPGDVLFLDGSHRTFMNSDVTVFFIDIMPVIKPGVIVHIHDIALPWDYDNMFVPWYWSEQYMLAVYMMAAGDRVRAVLPTSWTCRRLTDHPVFSQEVLDFGESGNQHLLGGGSMWFTKL